MDLQEAVVRTAGVTVVQNLVSVPYRVSQTEKLIAAASSQTCGTSRRVMEMLQGARVQLILQNQVEVIAKHMQSGEARRVVSSRDKK